MGPVILFDKSFLESLNQDEAVWFDHFFLSNVCPIFYVETLADLNKSLKQGRSPEQYVGTIADKFPEAGGYPCAFHIDLCIEDLLGNIIPLSWRIPLSDGKPVQTGDKKGVVFRLAPETEAFMRWQKREFLDIERLFAKTWRRLLMSPSRDDANHVLNAIGIRARDCKTLQAARAIAEESISSGDLLFEKMKFAVQLFNINKKTKREILKRWCANGTSSMASYAPYAAFVMKVEIFFLIALATSQLSCERASNRTDVGYLYYLPFCHVFVSSDKLHRKCAPLFMRHDQTFVWGEDLKGDLGRLNDFYSHLPQDERDKGLTSFAARPPQSKDCLVTRLWDTYLYTGDKSKSSRENIRAPKSHPAKSDDTNWIVIQRNVHKKRGSWYQVPKDLKES
jgi:hypothetical protein